MDTTRLRYFCTVARTVHVHRAAELLGVSPAALSKAIKQLESEVGVKLTSPSGRGITITEAGRTFAAKAEIVLAQLDDLQRQTAKAPAQRPVRLGSFEVFTTHAFGALLEEGLMDEPFLLMEAIPGQLEDAIARDELDLGVTYLPIPHPDLDFLKVATIRMGIFGRRDHFETFDSQTPFVAPAKPLEGTPTKVVGLDGWPDHLVRRNVRYRVTLMESALELCRRGRAVAFLPEFIVDLHNRTVNETLRLSLLPAPKSLTSEFLKQPVYLIKRKADPEGAAAKQVARALRIVCKASP